MSLENIFNPKSIAVVGASSTVGSLGNDLIKNLKDSEVEIYPVNPKYSSVENLVCYKDLSQIPTIPDLVIIAIPAIYVAQELKKLSSLGVKSAIVISAGFKETGVEGKKLEDEIADICLKNGITLVGVNCLGVMNTKIKLNASFAKNIPKKGNIALIAQSGALCTAIIDCSENLGLGFSKIISIGNKTTLSEIEVLEYLDADPDTKAIMMYIEDLKDPHGILTEVGKLTKPVIVLKAGRTKAGQVATSSHTGALSSLDNIYEALFRQVGFIRADTIEELFNYSLVFSKSAIQKVANVAIVTNAGGPGSIATDAIENNQLNLAVLSQTTRDSLSSALAKSASFKNPIDILGDAIPEDYVNTLKILALDPNIDSMLIILTPQAMTNPTKTAEYIVDLKSTTSKTIIASFMGGKVVGKAQKLLAKNGIAQIMYPDNAIKALGQLNKYYKNTLEKENLSILPEKDLKQSSLAKKILENHKNINPSGYLTSKATEQILEIYSLPIVKSKIVHSAKEAMDYVNLIDADMVMKIVSPDIIHKSEVQGVELDINLSNVEVKYADLLERVKKLRPEAKIQGIEISEMVNPVGGYELIIGVKDEGQIGKSIMFGMGGVLVEVLKDVTFSIAPIDLNEAENMIHRIKSHEIFNGVRGKPKLDTESLIHTILNISRLVTDIPEILELDINPLIIFPKGKGIKIVDSRIRVKIPTT